MNQIDLAGQHAVVTGGAQGIGFAIAKRLAASGAKITLWDMSADQLETAKASLAGAAAVVVDVSDAEAVVAAHKRSEAEGGPVSICVNSAGIAGPNASLDAYDVGWWKKVIDINLNGTFYVNRAVVPSMKARNYGRIVNIASIAGKEGNPNASAYSTSKAARHRAHQIARQGARELRHRRQLHHPGHREYAHPRTADAGVHRIHARAHSARPVPGGGRGRRHGRVAGLQGEQFYHRLDLRPLRRPRDLLSRRQFPLGRGFGEQRRGAAGEQQLRGDRSGDDRRRLVLMPGTPIGQVRRPSMRSDIPALRIWLRKRARLVSDPMRPT